MGNPKKTPPKRGGTGQPKQRKTKTAGAPQRPRVRENGDGTGILEIPVHLSTGPTRLPANESDYLAPTRPNGRPDTPKEELIKSFHSRGFPLERICIRTGVNAWQAAKILNIPTDTKHFQDTVSALAKRQLI